MALKSLATFLKPSFSAMSANMRYLMWAMDSPP
ncbi:MAG: hypothetical protein CISAcid_14670 [uncultured Acidilobus sp. CIS]|jgi:hypothetical protein|nr:MAG: hypothetical protein CISAcid_14670 [uncultured Acidilobus sp. CIS]